MLKIHFYRRNSDKTEWKVFVFFEAEQKENAADKRALTLRKLINTSVTSVASLTQEYFCAIHHLWELEKNCLCGTRAGMSKEAGNR